MSTFLLEFGSSWKPWQSSTRKPYPSQAALLMLKLDTKKGSCPVLRAVKVRFTVKLGGILLLRFSENQQN